MFRRLWVFGFALFGALGLMAGAGAQSAFAEVTPFDAPLLSCAQLYGDAKLAEIQALLAPRNMSIVERSSTTPPYVACQETLTDPSLGGGGDVFRYSLSYAPVTADDEAKVVAAVANPDPNAPIGESYASVIQDGLTFYYMPDAPGGSAFTFHNGFKFSGNDAALVQIAIANVDAHMAELNKPVATASAEPIAESPGTDVNAIALTGTNNQSWSTPSVFSTLAVFDLASISPQGVAAVAGGAVVFGALLAFPTLLLQRVTKVRYTEWSQRVQQVPFIARITSATQRELAKLPRTVAILLGLVVATIIIGLNNPAFGFNEESMRVFLSVFLGIAIESVAILAILAWNISRSGGEARIEFRAGSIVVVALTVLFTRLTNFQPGIVFGLLLILVIVKASPKVGEVANDALELALAMGVGFLAWLGYSAVSTLVGSGASVMLALSETLSAITLGTLSALPLLLVPIADLPGKRLFRERFKTWVVLAAASIALFFMIVMPFPDSWSTVSWPLLSWTLLFLAYALFAVIVWTVDVWRRSKSTHHAD